MRSVKSQRPREKWCELKNGELALIPFFLLSLKIFCSGLSGLYSAESKSQIYKMSPYLFDKQIFYLDRETDCAT